MNEVQPLESTPLCIRAYILSEAVSIRPYGGQDPTRKLSGVQQPHPVRRCVRACPLLGTLPKGLLGCLLRLVFGNTTASTADLLSSVLRLLDLLPRGLHLLLLPNECVQNRQCSVEYEHDAA